MGVKVIINIPATINRFSPKYKKAQKWLDAVDDEWLKSVVEFELIPLLKEYWFDEPTKIRTWSQTLQEVVK